MLMFGEVAPTRRTRGVMALSTTYKHPEGKMHNKKITSRPDISSS